MEILLNLKCIMPSVTKFASEFKDKSIKVFTGGELLNKLIVLWLLTHNKHIRSNLVGLLIHGYNQLC